MFVYTLRDIVAVGALLLIVVLMLLIYVPGLVQARVRHYKTRNTPPAVDQRWENADSRYTIVSIGATHIRVETVARTSTMGFGVPLEEWRSFVRRRRLYLSNPKKKEAPNAAPA